MKKFTRFLSVLLCVVMVFSLMPWGAVSAAEYSGPGRKAPVHRKGVPAQQKTIQNDGQYYTFTTFEDLQALASGSYSEEVYAIYIGEGTLTISENLYLPDPMVLVATGNMVVNAGVQFYATYLFAENLTVNGVVETIYAEVEASLDVNGTYYNYYQIHTFGYASYEGLSNVIHMDDAYGYIWFYPTNTAELKAAADEAAASTANGWYYTISFTEEMTITQNVTLPRNCDIYITDANVSVASGVTVTLEGYLVVQESLIIDGTLVDDGVVDIYYDEGGMLVINSGASCSGVGYIYVTSATLSDPFEATPGLTGYFSEYISDLECWVMMPEEEEPLPQLGAPTDLGWGYDYGTSQAIPGVISWKNGLPSTGEFDVVVFCDGSLYAEYVTPAHDESDAHWYSIYNFNLSDPDTGEYFFTVSAMDSNGEYAPSAAAMSERWYYIQPDTQIGECTNLGMSDTELSWDIPEDTSYVGGYEVILMYAPTLEDEPTLAGYVATYTGVEACGSVPFSPGEEGYYSFAVRLLSSDINQVCNGQWVELAEPVYFGDNSGGDNPGDDTGDDSQLPFDDFEWEVLKLTNRERLAEGLNPLTMYDLIQEATDIRAVEVDQLFDHVRPDGTDCFTVFDEVGIQCGAAGENIAWGQRTPEEVVEAWMNSEGHRANILRTYFTHMGVGFYQYSWVQLFTDGGKYTSIDVLTEEGFTVEPGTTIEEMDLVAVLNSTAYGDCYLPVEEEYCSGYNPDRTGTQTVTISVLGVSTTFDVIVGSAEEERMNGDFDHDGDVDEDDVIYLLWHTLFSEDYPIDINGDINGDGNTDEDDVIYLLWYTLFPEDYPL